MWKIQITISSVRSVCQIDMKFDRQLRPATETSWVVSYGGKTIPRWRTAAILKIDISPYLSEKSSDFHEILQQILNWVNVTYVALVPNEKVALDRLRVRQNVFLAEIKSSAIYKEYLTGIGNWNKYISKLNALKLGVCVCSKINARCVTSRDRVDASVPPHTSLMITHVTGHAVTSDLRRRFWNVGWSPVCCYKCKSKIKKSWYFLERVEDRSLSRDAPAPASVNRLARPVGCPVFKRLTLR